MTRRVATTDRVTDLLCEQLGVDAEQITADAHLCDDLGADSLDLVEIVMTIEEELKIEIDDEVAERWTHVRDIRSFYEQARTR